MYPQGDPQASHRRRPEAPCPPAPSSSSKSAATAHASLVPQLTPAGYTVTQTTDPDEAFPKVVEHQLAILDVGVADPPAKPAKARREQGRQGRATKDARRRPPRPSRVSICVARSGRPRPWLPCPSCAWPTPTTSRSASGSSRPAPTTSSRGRSTLARWRPGSRRCCCASSGPRHGAGHLVGRTHDGPGPPRHRRLQPQGRRRNDDDRDEHRRGGGAATAGPGGPGGPGPAVRRRRDPPEPERQADARRYRPGRVRRYASRSSCGRTRCVTTAGCT